MVETNIFTSVIAVDAQYTSESAAERTVRSGLSRVCNLFALIPSRHRKLTHCTE